MNRTFSQLCACVGRLSQEFRNPISLTEFPPTGYSCPCFERVGRFATLCFHVTSAPPRDICAGKASARVTVPSLVAFTSSCAAQTTSYSLLEVSTTRARPQAVKLRIAPGTNFRGIVYFTGQHHWALCSITRDELGREHLTSTSTCAVLKHRHCDHSFFNDIFLQTPLQADRGRRFNVHCRGSQVALAFASIFYSNPPIYLD